MRTNIDTIFLELGNMREQQQGVLRNVATSDIIQLLDWRTYTKLIRKNKLLPVTEKKSTKTLPTKSVLVKGKNPHIREHQHFNPDKKNKSKDRHKGIDDVISKLNKGGELDYKRLNNLINNHKSTNSEQMQDLFNAISDTAIAQEYVNPGSSIGTVFRNLDIDRKIAGSTVAGYLVSALTRRATNDNIRSRLIDFASSSITDVKKNSSNRDKDMAVHRLRNKAQFVDLKDRESFIDDELSKFVDQEYTEHTIRSNLFSRIGGKNKKATVIGDTLSYARNKVDTGYLSSILDHTIEKYGSSNVSKVYNKVAREYSPTIRKAVNVYMTGAGAKNDSQSASWQLLGASKNPKAVHDFMKKSKIEPHSLNLSDKSRITSVMDGWIRGSGHGIGALLRRSALHATGMPNFDVSSHLPNKHSIYPTKSLPSDKVPDKFLKTIKQLHILSKEFLEKKDVPNDLHRGITFDTAGKESITLRSMLSSASGDELIASSFAGSVDTRIGRRRNYRTNELKKLESNEGLSFPDTMLPYIKNVDAFSNKESEYSEKGFMIRYDKKKLIDDNKIFAVLSSSSFDFMNKEYGIPIPPMSQEYGDEQEYLLAI